MSNMSLVRNLNKLLDDLGMDQVKTRASARELLTLWLEDTAFMNNIDDCTVRARESVEGLGDNQRSWQDILASVRACVDKEICALHKKKTITNPYKAVIESCELLRLILALSARHGYPLLNRDAIENLVRFHITLILADRVMRCASPVLAIYREILIVYILPVPDYSGVIQSAEWIKIFKHFTSVLRGAQAQNVTESVCKIIHGLLRYQGACVDHRRYSKVVVECLCMYFSQSCDDNLATKFMLNAATHFCQGIALDEPSLFYKLDQCIVPNLVYLWNTRRIELRCEIVQFIRLRMRVYRPARPRPQYQASLNEMSGIQTSSVRNACKALPLDRHISTVAHPDIPMEKEIHECVMKDISTHTEQTARLHTTMPFLDILVTASTLDSLSAYEHQCYMDMAADVIFFYSPDAFCRQIRSREPNNERNSLRQHRSTAIGDIGVERGGALSGANFGAHTMASELLDELAAGDLLAIGIVRALVVKFSSVTKECMEGWLRLLHGLLVTSATSSDKTKLTGTIAYAIQGIASAWNTNDEGRTGCGDSMVWDRVVHKLVQALRKAVSSGASARKQSVCTDNILKALQSILENRLLPRRSSVGLLDQVVLLLYTSEPTRTAIDVLMTVLRVDEDLGSHTFADRTDDSGGDVFSANLFLSKPRMVEWLFSGVPKAEHSCSVSNVVNNKRKNRTYTSVGTYANLDDQTLGMALFALSHHNGALWYVPPPHNTTVNANIGCSAFHNYSLSVNRANVSYALAKELSHVMPSLEHENIPFEEEMLKVVSGVFVHSECTDARINIEVSCETSQYTHASPSVIPTHKPIPNTSIHEDILNRFCSPDISSDNSPQRSSSFAESSLGSDCGNASNVVTPVLWKIKRLSVLVSYVSLSMHLGNMKLEPVCSEQSQRASVFDTISCEVHLITTELARIVAKKEGTNLLNPVAECIDVLLNVTCPHSIISLELGRSAGREMGLDNFTSCGLGMECSGMIQCVRDIVQTSCRESLGALSNLFTSALRQPWSFAVVSSMNTLIEQQDAQYFPRRNKRRRLSGINGEFQMDDAFDDMDDDFGSVGVNGMNDMHGASTSDVGGRGSGGPMVDVLREVHAKAMLVPALGTLMTVLNSGGVDESKCVHRSSPKQSVPEDNVTVNYSHAIEGELTECLQIDGLHVQTLLLLPFFHEILNVLRSTQPATVLNTLENFLGEWNTQPMYIFALTIIQHTLSVVLSDAISMDSDKSACSVLVFLLNDGFGELYETGDLVGLARLLYLWCCALYLKYIPAIVLTEESLKMKYQAKSVIQKGLFDRDFEIRILSANSLIHVLSALSPTEQEDYVVQLTIDIDDRLNCTDGTISDQILESNMHAIMLAGVQCQTVEKIAFSRFMWVGYQKTPYSLIADEIVAFSMLLGYSTHHDMYHEFLPFALYSWLVVFKSKLENFPFEALGYSSFRELATDFTADIVAILFYIGDYDTLDGLAKLFYNKREDLILDNFGRVHAYVYPSTLEYDGRGGVRNVDSEVRWQKRFHKIIEMERVNEIRAQNHETLVIEMLMTMWDVSTPTTDVDTRDRSPSVPLAHPRHSQDILRVVALHDTTTHDSRYVIGWDDADTRIQYTWFGLRTDPKPHPPMFSSEKLRTCLGMLDGRDSTVRNPRVVTLVLTELGKLLADCIYSPSRRRLLSILAFFLNWLGPMTAKAYVYRCVLSILLRSLKIAECSFRQDCINLLAQTCIFGIHHCPAEAGKHLPLVMAALLRVSHPLGVECHEQKYSKNADASVVDLSTLLVNRLVTGNDVQNNMQYLEYLAKVEPLPDCTHFTHANKILHNTYSNVLLEVGNGRRRHGLYGEIVRFVENRYTLEAGSRLTGLKHLSAQLQTQRQSLNTILSSEDVMDRKLIVDLVHALINLCRPEIQSDVQLAAGVCLGELGPVDLQVLALHDATSTMNRADLATIAGLTYMYVGDDDWIKSRRLNILAKLVDYLTDTDAHVVEAAQKCLFCLMELPEIFAVFKDLKRIEGLEEYLRPFHTKIAHTRQAQKTGNLTALLEQARNKSGVDTRRLSSQLHAGADGSAMLMYDSVTMFTLDNLSLWTRVLRREFVSGDVNGDYSEGGQWAITDGRTDKITYVEWIKSTCCSLILQCGLEDKTLQSCLFVCPFKYDFCEFLLPQLVCVLLQQAASPNSTDTEHIHKLLSHGFRAFFAIAATNCSPFPDEKKAVRAMLSVLDHLRRVNLPMSGNSLHGMSGGTGASVEYTGSLQSTRSLKATSSTSSRLSSRKRSAHSKHDTSKVEVTLDVDYLQVCHAAYNAGSYLSSLMYLEIWCDITNTTLHEKEDDMDIAIDDYDLPEHKRLLLRIYSAINEPDSLAGAKFCLSYATRMRTQDHQRDYQGTIETSDLILHDERARVGKGMAGSDEGMKEGRNTPISGIKDIGSGEKDIGTGISYNPILTAMQNIGYSHMLEYYAAGLVAKHPELESEISEFQYEAAWRLGQWDAVVSHTQPQQASPTTTGSPWSGHTTSIHGGHNVHVNLYSKKRNDPVLHQLNFMCLKGLAEDNDTVFKSTITKLQMKVVSMLGQTGHEDIARTYKALAWLSGFNEMNELRNMFLLVDRGAYESDFVHMAELWDRRLETWKSNDFAYTEPVMAVRHVLLDILRNREEHFSIQRMVINRDSNEISTGSSIGHDVVSLPVRRLQLKHLHQYSKLARKVGRFHLSRQLINSMRHLSASNIVTLSASDFVGAEYSLWMLESAKVSRREDELETALAWLHRMRAVMERNQAQLLCTETENALMTTELERMAARAALLDGKWQSQRQAGTPSILIERIEKTIDSTVHLLNGDDALPAAYHTLATFADAHYQSIVEMMATTEWKEGIEIVKIAKKDYVASRARYVHIDNEVNKLKENGPVKSTADKAALSRLVRERHALSRHFTNVSRELKIDQEKNRVVNENHAKFLRVTLTNYLKCLKSSNNYDIRVFRLMSIWFETSVNSVTNKIMNKELQDIISSKFLPLIYQLAARLSGNADALTNCSITFESILYRLVHRLCLEHPYHSLTVVIALTQANRGVSAEKVQAADQMIESLAKQESINYVVTETLKLCKAYNDLAVVPVTEPMIKVGFDTIPDTATIARLKKMRIPIATAPPPVDPTGAYKNIVSIERFHRKFRLVGGVHHPKQIDCLGTDGKIYKQLVKNLDDLRQDAVMQQVFRMVNKLIMRHDATKKRNLIVRTYNVIPLTPQTGVLEWVSSTMALADYLVGKTNEKEPGAHQRIRPYDWSTRDIRKKLQAVNKFEDQLRVFKEACENFKPVFRCFFLEKYPDPVDWFDKRLVYTRSCAASSMIGYILGLGDRHPSNILIDVKTAQLVHIDLGIAFEQGKQLPMPEGVPFRLTRDVVDGMGIQGVEGVFRRCCESVLEVVRHNQELLLTILDVFIHDPLHSWTLSRKKAINKQREESQETALANVVPSAKDKLKDEDHQKSVRGQRILLRLKEKMNGRENGISFSVHGQVDYLIKEAQDPSLLCSLFSGWQQWI